jgi:hypothetical protein
MRELVVRSAKRDEPYPFALQRQIVATAHELLAGSISVTEAARRITGLATELGKVHDPPFVTFLGIESETDVFPLGDVRDRWNPSALQKQDAGRMRYEAVVRATALEACREILRIFGAGE